MASVKQFGDLRERPRVPLDARGHRRGCALQRLVLAGEVVVHEVKAPGVGVVLDLLAEAVGEPGEAARASSFSSPASSEMAKSTMALARWFRSVGTFLRFAISFARVVNGNGRSGTP
jgi:hypothetical protein